MVTTKRENVLEPAIFANISKAAGSSSPAEPIEQNVEWVDGAYTDFNFYAKSKEMIKTASFPDGTTFGMGCFAQCTNLETVVLPGDLVEIPGGMFNNCTSLAALTIPGSVKTIGTAFAGCSSLTTLTLPASTETVANDAFNDCIALTEINIHKPEGSIEGAPWGATNATVNWLG